MMVDGAWRNADWKIGTQNCGKRNEDAKLRIKKCERKITNGSPGMENCGCKVVNDSPGIRGWKIRNDRQIVQVSGRCVALR